MNSETIVSCNSQNEPSEISIVDISIPELESDMEVDEDSIPSSRKKIKTEDNVYAETQMSTPPGSKFRYIAIFRFFNLPLNIAQFS
jgi:hypothetical protein